jgi:hypothetical protein
VYVVEVAVAPLAGYDGAVPGHTGGAPLRTVTAVVVGAPLHNTHINIPTSATCIDRDVWRATISL